MSLTTYPEYEYDKRFMTLFPRMYSTDPDHIRQYEYWGRIKGKKVTVRSGAERMSRSPSPLSARTFAFSSGTRWE